MRQRAGVLVALVGVALTSCARGEPQQPLARAAAAGSVVEVQALLAQGLEPNAKDAAGLTALIYAARAGQVEATQALLRGGADAQLRGGRNGWTPLLHAIHKGQDQVALLLLGASSANQMQLDSALRMAAGYGNAPMVQALLAKGGNPLADEDDEGLPALTHAVGGAWDIDYQWSGCARHTATVRALLAAVPELTLKEDFWGRFARSYAERKGCSELISLLEQRKSSG